MHIEISGHKLEITLAIKQYIEAKSRKLTTHGAKILNIYFILEVNKHQQMLAEATAHAAGFDCFAKTETTDMYKSIDSVIDKLDKQLTKHHDKIKKH